MIAGGVFLGDIPLTEGLDENGISAAVVITDGDGLPRDPVSAPLFRIYGEEDVPMAGAVGALAKLDTAAISGATNATPIVVTDPTHGLQTGDQVTISGVVGNAAANGTFSVTVLTANTYSLQGSSGSGAYTTGGIRHLTGLYRLSHILHAGNGFADGHNYYAIVTWTIAPNTFSLCCPFRVI